MISSYRVYVKKVSPSNLNKYPLMSTSVRASALSRNLTLSVMDLGTLTAPHPTN